MLNVKIAGKKYDVYTLFSEINARKLEKGYDILNKAPLDVLMFLKDEENNDVPESSYLDFKIDWIANFSNIPKDVLKNVQPFSKIEVSIDTLYLVTKKFMYQPNEYIELPDFKLNGKRYELVKDVTTINGAKIYFGKGNYNQFKLANMLGQQIKGVNKPTTAQVLVQLSAVLYTFEGDNSDEAIEEKIKEFWNLDALTLWSTYFFFVELLSKWRSFFQSYTVKITYQNPMKVNWTIIKETLQRRYKGKIIGKLLKWRLLSGGFTIMDYKV